MKFLKSILEFLLKYWVYIAVGFVGSAIFRASIPLMIEEAEIEQARILNGEVYATEIETHIVKCKQTGGMPVYGALGNYIDCVYLAQEKNDEN